MRVERRKLMAGKLLILCALAYQNTAKFDNTLTAHPFK